MKCPYCGSQEGYYEFERVHRALYFAFDDEPDGASEDITDWCGKRKYCTSCHRVLPRKMFEKEDDQNE